MCLLEKTLIQHKYVLLEFLGILKKYCRLQQGAIPLALHV